uniref:Uncharacterized protein n=1 Tax=Anopheles atroparvus TaxID=41427 RepID=A0A182JH53_ANOAO
MILVATSISPPYSVLLLVTCARSFAIEMSDESACCTPTSRLFSHRLRHCVRFRAVLGPHAWLTSISTFGLWLLRPTPAPTLTLAVPAPVVAAGFFRPMPGAAAPDNTAVWVGNRSAPSSSSSGLPEGGAAGAAPTAGPVTAGDPTDEPFLRSVIVLMIARSSLTLLFSKPLFRKVVGDWLVLPPWATGRAVTAVDETAAVTPATVVPDGTSAPRWSVVRLSRVSTGLRTVEVLHTIGCDVLSHGGLGRLVVVDDCAADTHW